MKWSSMVCVLALCGSVTAGPKGDVIVHGVAPGSIHIDGDFSDWPLDRYTKISQQPPSPEGLNAFQTDAVGDMIVMDLDRVGLFNGTNPDNLTAAGPQDFGSTILLAHDGKYLYVVGSVIDQDIQGGGDTSEFGSLGFFNDGWEIFIDAKNDTEDDAAGNAFPAFDEEEPNLDDMQITFALNDNYLPDGSIADALGARQHIERTGTTALMGPFDPDTGAQLKNAPDDGGVSYRAFLDAAEAADGNPDIAAQSVDDLRAAGAPNPEIAANANEQFSGFVLEARIPFGIVPEFQPDHNVGFGLFWRDVDDEASGTSVISWMDWTQNVSVPCDNLGLGLFCGANWGELIFGEVPDVVADPLDCNGDGVVNAADLECANSTGILANLQSQLGIVSGDLDGNGSVEFADFLVLSANFGQALGSYIQGDIDGDGSVGFSDFLVLSANFGQTGSGVQAVPEPTTALPVSLLGIVLLASRRSRRRG